MKAILTFFLITLSFSACAEMQDSAGKAFENAGSVFRSGSDKMYTSGTGGPGSSVENSTGKALENAGSAVRSTGEKAWTEEEKEKK